MALLSLRNVSAFYNGIPIIEGVSFELQRGETLAVLGPNGSGKTTLLRAIIGSIPHTGEIIMEKGVRIGYVPQKLDLERNLPLTVREFLSLAPRPDGAKDVGIAETLELISLPKSYLARPLSTLSSGEFQRVLVGFAFMTEPTVLLFDEPTASVDVAGQETVYDLLERLQKARFFALVLISHDLSVVYQHAHRVLCLNRSHAHVGTPEELTPEHLKNLYGRDIKFHSHIHHEV